MVYSVKKAKNNSKKVISNTRGFEKNAFKWWMVVIFKVLIEMDVKYVGSIETKKWMMLNRELSKKLGKIHGKSVMQVISIKILCNKRENILNWSLIFVKIRLYNSKAILKALTSFYDQGVVFFR